MSTNMQSSMWLLTIAIVLAYLAVAQGCSCMPTHPQQMYCESDFVILARVKREYTHNDTRIYKVRIRKEYKMSEKAEVALKSGRLLTAREDSLCGVQLERGKLYAIAGKIVSLKARINRCSFTQRWENLSKRQRKGLNRMYKQGCSCRIKTCYRAAGHCQKARDFCNWTTWHPNDKLDCQRMQGICLRSASNQCTWARNKLQTTCTRNLLATTTTTPPPLTISLWSG